MKKITLFTLLGISLLILSCNETIEPVDQNESIRGDSEIVINKKNKILLKDTELSLSEIEDSKCGEGLVKTIYAGQHINVGELLVSNDETNLYVTYKVMGNWFLTESHLYVGPYGDLPLNGGGNPKIGNFPYHGAHQNMQEYTFTIPLNQIDKDINGCFIVAAHGVVKEIVDGKVVGSETAWGQGDDEFPGNRWGWYITYCEEECDENDCLIAASYKIRKPENSNCYEYLDNETSRIAWTTKYAYSWLNSIDYATGLPLFANPSNCELESDHLSVAEVDLKLSDDGSELTINYDANEGYMLTSIDLYVGLESTPINPDGSINSNLNNDNFIKINFNGGGKTSHTVTIPWQAPNGNENQLIWVSAQADVCPISD